MIGDTPPIDYIVGRKNYDCTLANINTFAQGSYGFGFPKTENSQKFKVRVITSIFLKMSIFSELVRNWFDGCFNFAC